MGSRSSRVSRRTTTPTTSPGTADSRSSTGPRVSIHALAEATYAHDALDDGEVIAVGEVTIRVDPHAGPPPRALRAPSSTERELAPAPATRSSSATQHGPISPSEASRGRRGALPLAPPARGAPRRRRVYPGHVAGSLCGARSARTPSSTIGFERRFNRALAIGTSTSSSPTRFRRRRRARRTMDRIVELNRGPFVGAPAAARAARRRRRGERPRRSRRRRLRRGHLPRAVNVPLSGSSFATRPASSSPGRAGRRSTPLPTTEAESAARGLRAVGCLRARRLRRRSAGRDGAPRPGGPRRARAPDAERRGRSSSTSASPTSATPATSPGHATSRTACSPRSSDGLGELPVVTICETGARAAIAASVLAAPRDRRTARPRRRRGGLGAARRPHDRVPPLRLVGRRRSSPTSRGRGSDVDSPGARPHAVRAGAPRGDGPLRTQAARGVRDGAHAAAPSRTSSRSAGSRLAHRLGRVAPALHRREELLRSAPRRASASVSSTSVSRDRPSHALRGGARPRRRSRAPRAMSVSSLRARPADRARACARRGSGPRASGRDA